VGLPISVRLNMLVNSTRRLTVARSLIRKIRPKLMFSPDGAAAVIV